jgi:hypothetical protein
MKALFFVLMIAMTLPAFAEENVETDCLATQDTDSRANPKTNEGSERPADNSGAVSV